QEDMKKKPEEPGEEAGRFDRADVSHGRSASNNRHVAVIAIVEWCERLAANGTQDVFRRMFAFLHGDLRDARKRAAILLQRTEVADDKDLRVSRHCNPSLRHNPTDP